MGSSLGKPSASQRRLDTSSPLASTSERRTPALSTDSAASLSSSHLCVLQPGHNAIRLPCLHVFRAEPMIAHLESQNTPTCPIDGCPVPKNQIRLFPVWTWSEEDARRERRSAGPASDAGTRPAEGSRSPKLAICAVDFNPLELGQAAVRLPCLHVFHAECILPTLRNDDNPKCPIDGLPVNKNDIPRLPVWLWGCDSSDTVPVESSTPADQVSAALGDEVTPAPHVPQEHNGMLVCGIDLSRIESGEIVVRLPCQHVFHAECLLQYVEGMENVTCPLDQLPVTRQDLAGLPMLKWRGASPPSESNPLFGELLSKFGVVLETSDNEHVVDCPIDLCPIEDGQMAVRLPCMHVFHAACILPHLENSDNPQCPIDRLHIDKEDVPRLPTWRLGTAQTETDAATESAIVEALLDTGDPESELRESEEAANANEQVDCVIDLVPIERGDKVLRLPCLHVFHADCIMGYLEREENPKCPIDRSPVEKDSIPHLPVWRWGLE